MYSYANIGLFFNLTINSKVFICGNDLVNWHKDFLKKYPNSIYVENLKYHNLDLREKTFDLIIIQVSKFSRGSFRKVLHSQAMRMLSDKGAIIVVDNN